MNALAHYYAAAASAFHDIFYHKLPENFSRNYSRKVPLFFRKCRRKFPEISELPTLPRVILEKSAGYVCVGV